MNENEKPKRKGAFKVETDKERKIFNNTWKQNEKPIEMFRTDFISAMKIPDQSTLDRNYVLIIDAWKQEYDKGVQVPVDLDSMPTPEFSVISPKTNKPDFVRPEEYISQIEKVMPLQHGFVRKNTGST